MFSILLLWLDVMHPLPVQINEMYYLLKAVVKMMKDQRHGYLTVKSRHYGISLNFAKT